MGIETIEKNMFKKEIFYPPYLLEDKKFSLLEIEEIRVKNIQYLKKLKII